MKGIQEIDISRRPLRTLIGSSFPSGIKILEASDSGYSHILIPARSSFVLLSLIFIYNPGFISSGFYVNISYKERNLILLMEAFP